MHSGRTTTVETPSIGNECATEGFRIGDVKTEAGGFLDGLTSLLAVLPPASLSQDILASELKLKSLQEAIQSGLGTPAPESAAKQQRPATLPAPPSATATSLSGAPEPTSIAQEAPTITTATPPVILTASSTEPILNFNPLETVDERQLEKLHAVEAYNSAVAAIKSKHEEGRRDASKHLRSLRIKSRDEGKLGNRSFHKILDDGDAAHELEISSDEEEGVETEAREQGRTPATNAHIAAATPAIGGDSSIPRNQIPVPPGEIVVRVAVHLPHAPAHVSEEWLLLGSQKLSELRDTLFCLVETNLKNVEREENLRRSATGAPLLSLSKPWAYFYIEGTFYVDKRSPDTTDLSEGIRSHLRKNGISAPLHPIPSPASRPLGSFTTDFTTASMHETAFEDIWVRLGSGAAGLYCHQGGCEHLIVFQDVRAYDTSIDPQYVHQYPVKVRNPGVKLSRKRQCEACALRPAHKVTQGDRSAPHTPYFWCKECFGQMHYDEEGKALYTDYKVFPYHMDYLTVIMHEKNFRRKV